MAEGLELEVATPERELVRERVSEVELRGKSGYMGILPGHAPLVAELGIGHLTYVAGRRRWFVPRPREYTSCIAAAYTRRSVRPFF